MARIANWPNNLPNFYKSTDSHRSGILKMDGRVGKKGAFRLNESGWAKPRRGHPLKLLIYILYKSNVKISVDNF
jgi:hypothetical protein